ncbi:sugar phosphate isomerase/epimerase family protein [Microbulbifer harenosus]|uniref:Sugar phosphate isomerase/epimerase n=1 Tax=Microbulbifer harenosus TaxID=2576840 RepID=A0ABY2UCZ9_9GAMM|nr:sugar phosphate isomerase/epimerase [Microbulbifer harenosus]TLM73982.1 sugar phosphate isomerase/epimerase [Microbulbifer harenosus]
MSTIAAAEPELHGVQLYTLRNQMEESVPATLAKVADAGYRTVELAGFYGHSAADVRNLLERSGLRAPASHFPLEQMESDFSAVIAEAKALGSQYVVLAWLEQSRRSASDYRKLVQNLNDWGRQCRDAGLRLAYHNHDFEFEETGGFVPYQLLLDNTDPATVYFEMDLYWMHKAGQQPASYFARYPGRFPLWHLKDADTQGGMADVGQGVIDFPALLSHAAPAGLEYAFVERDDAVAPHDSIQRSLRALKRWG